MLQQNYLKYMKIMERFPDKKEVFFYFTSGVSYESGIGLESRGETCLYPSDGQEFQRAGIDFGKRLPENSR